MSDFACYSLHRKKVYTCGKAKYSKPRQATGKGWGCDTTTIGAPPTCHLAPLNVYFVYLCVYFLLGETVYLNMLSSKWSA